MKKTFEFPVIEVVEFETENILLGSGENDFGWEFD